MVINKLDELDLLQYVILYENGINIKKNISKYHNLVQKKLVIIHYLHIRNK